MRDKTIGVCRYLRPIYNRRKRSSGNEIVGRFMSYALHERVESALVFPASFYVFYNFILSVYVDVFEKLDFRYTQIVSRFFIAIFSLANPPSLHTQY